MASNKNSASEDAIGTLHNYVTQGFTHIIKSGLDKIKDPDTPEEEKIYLLDSKDLSAAAKFCDNNGIGALAPESDGNGEMSKELDSLKKKHAKGNIKFLDEDYSSSCG